MTVRAKHHPHVTLSHSPVHGLGSTECCFGGSQCGSLEERPGPESPICLSERVRLQAGSVSLLASCRTPSHMIPSKKGRRTNGQTLSCLGTCPVSPPLQGTGPPTPRGDGFTHRLKTWARCIPTHDFRAKRSTTENNMSESLSFCVDQENF